MNPTSPQRRLCESDRDLRMSQRQLGGDLESRIRYYQQLVRAGGVTRAQLAHASRLGDPAAQALTQVPEAERVQDLIIGENGLEEFLQFLVKNWFELGIGDGSQPFVGPEPDHPGYEVHDFERSIEEGWVSPGELYDWFRDVVDYWYLDYVQDARAGGGLIWDAINLVVSAIGLDRIKETIRREILPPELQI